MITEEKIKWIRKQLSKGEPEGEIKNQLRKEGYTGDEIATVFFNLFLKKSSLNKVKSIKDNNGQMVNLIGVCFLIAGVSMFIINTWLRAYSIALIILGVIILCIKYIFPAKSNQK